VQTRHNGAVSKWSRWERFPDPRRRDILRAPLGPGTYELRNRETGELVLIGSAKNCAYRLTSLLPPPLGQGTRRNDKKRQYVLRNLGRIDFRYYPCLRESEARQVEARRLREASYLFGT
jgi:hypothetical protein